MVARTKYYVSQNHLHIIQKCYMPVKPAYNTLNYITLTNNTFAYSSVYSILTACGSWVDMTFMYVTRFACLPDEAHNISDDAAQYR